METPTSTPEIQTTEIKNLEPLKLPLALTIGKWSFWATVFLYIAYIGMTYFLDWKYPEGVNREIIDNMKIFNL